MKILKKISILFQFLKHINSLFMVFILILRNIYSIKLILSPNEYIDSIIIKEGFYESEITESILKIIEDGDVFWDIGSNIGCHAIAINSTKPNSKVICFEPNPHTLHKLLKNIKINNCNIEVFQTPLSDDSKSLDLYLMYGNSGMSTITPWSDFSYSEKKFSTSLELATLNFFKTSLSP